MYGSETWTLGKLERTYLKSFETWCCRRKKVNWSEKVINEEVIELTGKKRALLNKILRKKSQGWSYSENKLHSSLCH